VGYALVPRSVEGLHREGLVYVPLADSGVTSPVIMNCRVGDASQSLARLKELVTATA
jgi:hypothetical protein